MKEQLALLLGRDEDDVRLYELLSDERRLALALQQEKERQARLARAKSAYQAAPPPASAASTAASALAEFVQAPLDCERKVSEWGLQSDAIVLFVYRKGEGEDWEEMEAEGVVDRRPTARRAEEKEKDEQQQPQR